MKDSTPEQTGAFEHPYDPPCDGSSECKALIHLHGCFSDKGHCDAPQEHSSGAIEPKSHYAINPDPYRVRAAAMLKDENAKVRALAGVVIVMCDSYDEMKATLGIQTGQIVEWPGG